MYEYIPESIEPLDDEAVQKTLDFLWRVGFSFNPTMLQENWLAGRLLDIADLQSPWCAAWSRPGYKKQVIGSLGRSSAFFQGPKRDSRPGDVELEKPDMSGSATRRD